MKSFEIAGVPVGEGHPPILLPDIGTFFNQDTALAETMIAAVKAAGCRFLKGEVLHRPDICLDDETLEIYHSPEEGAVSERYYDLISRKVVPLETYAKLFARARDLGMHVVVSVYDIEGIAFACREGVAALKIASSNIVHEPLITVAAASGLPLLLDTGKAGLEEMQRAVQWARDGGAEKLIIEHSPDAPPRALEHHHLRMLATLAESFACPVGLSDHHAGNEMMIAAAALGTSVLEKGVVADDAGDDQDVAHAMRLGELAALRQSCLNVHSALGQAMRALPADRPRPTAWMGLIARRDLAEGEEMSLETVDFAFPAKGIGTENWSDVKGRRARRALRKGTPIGWSDVELLAS